MFWIQCDKIVTSGGPVKCDFCPCPKYIYVTRCDKTENDFDDCDCNPETAWERARLVTYFASENGCINVDGAWRRLNHTYYPADGSEFSANGSVYKAIETGENGPKTYDTRQKAQTEWDAHPKSHWGEKVIAACTCCCWLPVEAKITLNYTLSYQDKTIYSDRTSIAQGTTTAAYQGTIRLTQNSNKKLTGTLLFPETFSFSASNDDVSVACNSHPRPAIFEITLGEDCRSSHLSTASLPTYRLGLWDSIPAEYFCNNNPYVIEHPVNQDGWTHTHNDIDRLTSYPEGTYILQGNYHHLSHDTAGDAVIATYDNSSSVSVTLKVEPVEDKILAFAYNNIYELLSDDLKN